MPLQKPHSFCVIGTVTPLNFTQGGTSPTTANPTHLATKVAEAICMHAFGMGHRAKKRKARALARLRPPHAGLLALARKGKCSETYASVR